MLLSITEAAQLLGVDRSTFYRWIKGGDVPFPVLTVARRLRVPVAPLLRWIDGQTGHR